VSFAAIDIGTNSVKLLVGQVADDRVVPELHRVTNTRLGEGLHASGAIAPAAADRTIATLAEYRKLAEERKAGRVAAVGTQVLRAATNAAEFVDRCTKEAGLSVRVLTGEEEARLSFQGASWAAQAPRTLGVDIGGGSTEIMAGTRSGLERSWSLPIGAVVLTEQYLKSDPPGEDEMHLMSAAIERQLKGVDAKGAAPAEFVGIGGTVAALVGLTARKAKADPRTLHQTRIPFDEVSALAIHLSLRTTAEREEMGLERGRADIIVAGAWILTATMSYLGASALRASAHGLRHGLIIEMASGRWS
jgi:exopolyphosphatase/guanosine-5'-triphosphate,3'-diphosphate pyrophosphatase